MVRNLLYNHVQHDYVRSVSTYRDFCDPCDDFESDSRYSVVDNVYDSPHITWWDLGGTLAQSTKSFGFRRLCGGFLVT